MKSIVFLLYKETEPYGSKLQLKKAPPVEPLTPGVLPGSCPIIRVAELNQARNLDVRYKNDT